MTEIDPSYWEPPDDAGAEDRFFDSFAASVRAAAQPTVSLRILRAADGPLTTREITRATAKEMGWSLMYEDVASVLRRHVADGDAEVEESPDGWLEDRWTARP